LELGKNQEIRQRFAATFNSNNKTIAKFYSTGNGVVLTATWLLPVALIPMAWDTGDIYAPLLLPKPEDRVPPSSQDNEKEQLKEKKRRFWPL
jgi:hypothetical protein